MKRKTRQRIVLCDVFTMACRPLKPQEVVALAQQSIPTLGIATVYRAIKDLVAEGWLVPVGVAGSIRYELATLGYHHHFYCQACDRTFDVPGCNDSPAKLAPEGFVVSSHELTLNGTCSSCTGRG